MVHERGWLRFIVPAVLLLLLASGPPQSRSAPDVAPGPPLSFEENWGQFDPDVALLARGRDFRLAVTQEGAELLFDWSRQNSLRIVPVGTQGTQAPAGLGEVQGLVHYLTAPYPGDWVTGVPTYA
ncbi:MAG TPA: hypothetical protein VFG08_02270, partial [Candidatus Polarisedimenticolia bacterium]|nr:hypothetical protein [Candidatus Polarisedimenticolia bacterium]